MDINKDFRSEQSSYYYISTMRPLFNRRALFSDMTEDFVSPMEPNAFGRVKIRFRSEKDNVDNVYLHLQTQTDKLLMLKASTDDLFDYYAIEMQLSDAPLLYYFEIQSGKAKCYYDLRGSVEEDELDPHFMMRIIPGFKTPDWAKGAVMYQIYIDRFYNGDPRNDVLSGEYAYVNDHTEHVNDWGKYPATMGVREFYGGDLQGVLEKLDYLEDLGIDVIYFNPLYVSPSNHKYDIQDYDYIYPHIGES
jgi:alpha-glucosidase